METYKVSDEQEKAEGEIKPKFYKVYYDESTNWGYEPVAIKYFEKFENAQKYAKSLLDEDMGEAEGVVIEDENGKAVERWVAEEERIEYYPRDGPVVSVAREKLKEIL
jgi:hypothetical protein